jgi:hypothetical protein
VVRQPGQADVCADFAIINVSAEPSPSVIPQTIATTTTTTTTTTLSRPLVYLCARIDACNYQCQLLLALLASLDLSKARTFAPCCAAVSNFCWLIVAAFIYLILFFSLVDFFRSVSVIFLKFFARYFLLLQNNSPTEWNIIATVVSGLMIRPRI